MARPLAAQVSADAARRRGRIGAAMAGEIADAVVELTPTGGSQATP
jgi:hypothetical protein